MKSLLFAATAAAAFAFAAPAFSQSYPSTSGADTALSPSMPVPADGVWSLDRRENWLQARIDRGVDEHRLSGKEAARGNQELHAIHDQEAQLLARDGGALSPEDRSYLVHRLDELNQTLRWEGRNPPPPWAQGM